VYNQINLRTKFYSVSTAKNTFTESIKEESVKDFILMFFFLSLTIIKSTDNPQSALKAILFEFEIIN